MRFQWTMVVALGGLCLLAGCDNGEKTTSTLPNKSSLVVGSAPSTEVAGQPTVEANTAKLAPPLTIADLPWRELLKEHIPGGLDEARFERMFRHLQLDNVASRDDGKWSGRVIWRSTAAYTLHFEPPGIVRVARGVNRTRDTLADKLVFPSETPPSGKTWLEWLREDPNRAAECKVQSPYISALIPLPSYCGLAIGGKVSAHFSQPDQFGIRRCTLTSEGSSYSVVFEGRHEAEGLHITRLNSINDLSPAAFLKGVEAQYTVVEQ